MTTNSTLNTAAVIDACDYIARHSRRPNGIKLSSCWLFDNAMRAFQHPAARSITFDVLIDGVGEGYATICTDGSRYIHRDMTLTETL